MKPSFTPQLPAHAFGKPYASVARDARPAPARAGRVASATVGHVLNLSAAAHSSGYAHADNVRRF